MISYQRVLCVALALTMLISCGDDKVAEEEVPVQKVSVEEVLVEEVLVQEVLVEEVLVQEVLVEEVLVEEVLVEEVVTSTEIIQMVAVDTDNGLVPLYVENGNQTDTVDVNDSDSGPSVITSTTDDSLGNDICDFDDC